MLSKFCLILVILCSLVLDVEGVTTRGQQLGPDPNMPPEELLSFNLNNNNNNQYLNEFGKPRSHTKGEMLHLKQAWATSGPRETCSLKSTLMWPTSYLHMKFFEQVKNQQSIIKTTLKIVQTYSKWNTLRIICLPLMWPAKSKKLPTPDIVHE